MKKLGINLCICVGIALVVCGCSPIAKQDESLHLIPKPLKVEVKEGRLSIDNGYIINVQNEKLKPLIPIIAKELFMLTGVCENCRSDKSKALPIHLILNTKLQREQYDLDISNKGILLEGGSYQAVAEGSVTLLQLINKKNELPNVEIHDHPAYSYRGLMIDVARSWHSIKTLKQIVILCRWYKIKYLQLHLTDDQSFTFPSKAYPLLPTKGRHYTWNQLVELDKYARQRGVIIIPEIDVPSHSSSFITAMPKLFGIKDWKNNSNTLDMGKDTVYGALKVIIGELSEIFPETPYIHIGTDEVFMGGMKNDPSIKHYMAVHKLHSLNELYRSFMIRVADIVKSYGKQAIVWNGFQKGDTVKIPKDIIVMEYLPFKYRPQELIDDGYKVINASFKPLYNGWGNAEDVYNHWNIFNWQLPRNDLTGEYKGIEVTPTKQIIGASMSSWAQPETQEIPSLRRKIAAMSEQLWNDRKKDSTEFMQDLDHTDNEFGHLLSPVEVSVKGIIDPNPCSDVQRFDSAVTIQLKASLPNIKLYYTLDGSCPGTRSSKYDTSLTFNRDIKLRIQAYDTMGNKVGFVVNRDYMLKPVYIGVRSVNGDKRVDLFNTGEVNFNNSITVTLKSKIGKYIMYSLKGEQSQIEHKKYMNPIKINHTTNLTAQAYDAFNNPIGTPTGKDFVKVRNVTSLTTNKPVSSSTDAIDPRLAKLVVDGKVSDNDYWNGVAGGWVEIDLEKQEKIAQFKVYTFWDNYRYYQYVIQVSKDGEHWKEVVNFSHNTTKATSAGYTNNIIPAVRARYIKIIMLYNSVNPIMHLVELDAFSSVSGSIK